MNLMFNDGRNKIKKSKNELNMGKQIVVTLSRQLITGRFSFQANKDL